MSEPLAVKVVVVDDNEPMIRDVAEAISAAFTPDVDAKVELIPLQVSRSSSVRERADAVMSNGPQVVLTDGYMPNPSDGITLIRELRVRGYAGFTYLWTSSPASVVVQDVRDAGPLLNGKGRGGFSNQSQVDELGHAIAGHYGEDPAGFAIHNPGGLGYDLHAGAREIIAALLPLCWSATDREAVRNAGYQLLGSERGQQLVQPNFLDMAERQLGIDHELCQALRDRELQTNDDEEAVATITTLREDLFSIVEECRISRAAKGSK